MDLAQALGGDRGDGRLWASAQLLSVDTTKNRAQVSVDGGPAVWLPFLGASSAYSGVTIVGVLRDPTAAGAGQLVLGPMGTQAAADVPNAPAPPESAQPITVGPIAFTPTWSGSWRSSVTSYDRWNVDRYGGRSTLYQGNAYGSGPMTGLAVYGNQIVNLQAASITSMVLTVKLATGSGTVTVQGSPSGAKPAGAPTSSGSTASRSGSGSIALPADVCEAFRTGATKGLALVGTSYLAVYGTPSGMALSVTYTRNP